MNYQKLKSKTFCGEIRRLLVMNDTFDSVFSALRLSSDELVCCRPEEVAFLDIKYYSALHH